MSNQIPDNSPLPESTPLDWLTPALPYQDANRQPNMPYPEAGTEVIGLDGIDPSQQGAPHNQSHSDNSTQTSDSGGPASAQGVNDYSPSAFYF